MNKYIIYLLIIQINCFFLNSFSQDTKLEILNNNKYILNHKINKISEFLNDTIKKITKYNRKGNKLWEKYFDENNKVNEIILFNYDNNEHIISEKILSKIKYLCDTNIVKYFDTISSPILPTVKSYINYFDTSETETHKYYYDKKGILVISNYDERQFWEKKEVNNEFTFIYNKSNNISQIYKNHLIDGIRYQYFYDSNYYLTKKTYHSYWPLFENYNSGEQRWVYDSTGRVIEMYHKQFDSFNIHGYFSYVYDDNINMICKILKNESGEIMKITSFKYYDNKTIKSEFDSNYIYMPIQPYSMPYYIKNYNINGKVKFYKDPIMEVIYEYNDDGLFMTEYRQDEKSILKYNSDNELINETKYNRRGTFNYHYTYQKDTINNVITVNKLKFGEDGNLLEYFILKYDVYGNLIDEKAIGTKLLYSFYYNGNNKLEKIVFYKNNHTEYLFDKSENLIEVICYKNKDENEIYSKEKYIYDKYGLLKNKLIFNNQSEINNYINYKYTFY